MGLIAGPERPPPPVPTPSVGRRVSASTERPRTVLTRVSPVGPGVERRGRDRLESGDVRRELREDREAEVDIDHRADRSRGRLGIVREHLGAVVQVRTADVDLDRDDVARRDRAASSFAATVEVVDSCPQTDAMTRAPVRAQAREVVRDPVLRRRDPAARPCSPCRPSSCATAARGCPPTRTVPGTSR